MKIHEKLFEIQNNQSQVVFREATEDDLNLIRQSWIRSYRVSSDVHRCFDDIYFPEESKIIEESIVFCDIVILAFAANPDVILGYIIAERVKDSLIIDWIGIKKAFRRMGICDYLIENLLKIYPDIKTMLFTHWPAPPFEFIVANQFKKHGIRFNPFLKHRHM